MFVSNVITVIRNLRWVLHSINNCDKYVQPQLRREEEVALQAVQLIVSVSDIDLWLQRNISDQKPML